MRQVLFLLVRKAKTLRLGSRFCSNSPSSHCVSETSDRKKPPCLPGTEMATSGQGRVIERPDILYQCENFVAINKPWDISVNSDDADHVTVETLMDRYYPHLRDDKLGHGYRFSHRLDYATSGVLCISLTKKAGGLIAKRFLKRDITKHYLALVHGHMAEKYLVIDVPIGSDATYTDVHRMCVYHKDKCEKALSAVTEVYCLEEGIYDTQPASKVLLVPKTGRTHQLRVHSDHIGHRIVGDYTYSNRTDTEPFRMMLHAFRLKFKLRKDDSEFVDIRSADPFTSELIPPWQSSKVLTTYEDLVGSFVDR